MIIKSAKILYYLSAFNAIGIACWFINYYIFDLNLLMCILGIIIGLWALISLWMPERKRLRQKLLNVFE